MHALDLLGDPVRRRILELLARGEQASGALVAVIQREFGISQPAVSQHLRVLRDAGFATVRVDGARRLYSVAPAPLLEVDAWLEQFRGAWEHRLDALATEIARGKRQRQQQQRAADAEKAASAASAASAAATAPPSGRASSPAPPRGRRSASKR